MSSRATKLTKHLDAVLLGKKKIEPENAKLFIEAICAQQDRAACLRKIMGSKTGLSSLQSSLRIHTTPDFFNNSCTDLLTYLQPPELKDIGGGQFLTDILLALVEPDFFWAPFSRAFMDGKLKKEAMVGFAWMLHHLVSLPPLQSDVYRTQATSILSSLTEASDGALKAFGTQIQLVLEASSTGSVPLGGVSPGGRHDNDFVDFRDIAILPTSNEINCTEAPFLRRSTDVDDTEKSARVATHLDNQFRLYREDMLYELRDDVQTAFGKKKGFKKSLIIDELLLKDPYFGTDKKKTKWGLIFECQNDIGGLKGVKEAKNRQKFLEQHDNRNFLRHLSTGCLVVEGKIITFATLNRDETLLIKEPPFIILQIEGELAVTETLVKLKSARDVKFIQIDTALFAYEPVLRALQRAQTLPLSAELLLWDSDSILSEVDSQPPLLMDLARTLRVNPRHDLQHILGLKKSIKLDASQAGSLVAGITQKVSLIQGPPGTGKSFIGSLIAKAIHDLTKQTILVICYTNHALDDILTSLLDVGIPEESMVRLGGKSTARTQSLIMRSQTSTYKRDKDSWAAIGKIKSMAAEYERGLCNEFKVYNNSDVSLGTIMDHLEFEEPSFYSAFQVPKSTDGFTRVASSGRAVDQFYLLEEWSAGRDGGVFKDDEIVRESAHVWEIPVGNRQELIKKWTTVMYEDQVRLIYSTASKYNKYQDELGRHFSDKDTEILRSKRIIGCTTTAAAKYSENLHAASPDVLLVEEAGEILESHVLTALTSQTSQLILIGDHKQLRPKVNNYDLTVEKGEGFDLNRSLFERLILKDYPHAKLTEQHRMRPEISALIRALTYPELSNAPRTQNRPDLCGAQDNIIFIDHDHPEDNSKLSDRKDGGATSSKQNSFEVEMVLKILKYFAQQGYRSEEMVILTPYLGQLQILKKAISKDQNAILNDLDTADLIAAGGGIPSTKPPNAKQSVRLATIDNYQGEESDIVIVSLTRSNSRNDIGFMFSPERLNVLLSRARNALIMIGNSKTFTNSRKGGELWKHLMKLLTEDKHVYDGLPVRCDRHKDKTARLKLPTDFEQYCPDGGCTEPCGIKLSCNQHNCPLKCHKAYDHSQILCHHPFHDNCPQGHLQTWECHENHPTECQKCKREAEVAEKKRQRDIEMQLKRDAEELTHQREMDKLNEAIAQQDLITKEARLAAERAAAIENKMKDLENATARAKNPPSPSQSRAPPPGMTLSPPQPIAPVVTQTNVPPASQPLPTPPTSHPTIPPPPSSQPTNAPTLKPKQTLKPLEPSPSQLEWQRMKNIEGAFNDAIDEIMAMTGLEEVKKEVLTIKVLIDTKKRQGVSFSEERLNTAMLGNPGTGKTTIARLYARMLASLGVLPGSAFFESTGSSLAHEGVAGLKGKIAQIKGTGGGTIFIDEAYQLTSPHNVGGRMVLDYLLAEMENNTGKIVFLLAGYSKEMEKFFEHNPGLLSRVPYKLNFTDYTDEEFLRMFESMVGRHFTGKPWAMEDGIVGLYARVAIRRLGRGRGKQGFGNARALRIMFDRILRRQALRLNQERKDGWITDDFYLSKGDLIGPDPAKARVNSEAWKELQSLVGLQAVKDSLGTLMSLVDGNYQRELKERKPSQIALNRVFLGSPGTGKTTVARLYGRILADLGLLSDGEGSGSLFNPQVIEKNPADFMGSHIGQSEEKTKGILASTVGKVLIIDEAYMLHGGRNGHTGSGTDSFKTAIIDTLVAEIQNVPGEDRCVLLLGYKEEMTEFFQNVNPGLSRRFAMEDAFNFEDFTTPQLLQILELKMAKDDLAATDVAKATALQVLDREKNKKNFGNGGAVDNLLSKAKLRYTQRQKGTSDQFVDTLFEPQDFDPEHDRGTRASTNLAKLFEDIVGREDVVKKLSEFQRLAQALKSTGKTTIARKMGQVYFDMGFLSSPDVVECSASDLVGEYLGHTGPKTRKVFEKALGQVLFIDEAYRLNDDRFAKEAVDEIVALLTLDRFKSKIIVILAGYEKDINGLLGSNPGLSSRFPEEIFFHNLQPARCLEILRRELAKVNVQLPALNDPASGEYVQMSDVIARISVLPTWGNARDMIQLSKTMIAIAILKAEEASAPPADPMVLAFGDAIGCMMSMLDEQRKRFLNLPDSRKRPAQSPSIQILPSAPTPPTAQSASNQQQSGSAPPPPSPPQAPSSSQQQSGSAPPPSQAPSSSQRQSEKVPPPSQAPSSPQKHSRSAPSPSQTPSLSKQQGGDAPPARIPPPSSPRQSPSSPPQSRSRQQQGSKSPLPPASPAQSSSSGTLPPTATSPRGNRQRQGRKRSPPPSKTGQAPAPAPRSSAAAQSGSRQSRNFAPSSPIIPRPQLPQHSESPPIIPHSPAGRAGVQRDAGVSDDIWNQLEASKRAERERERRRAVETENLKRFEAEKAQAERNQKAEAAALERAIAKEKAEREENERRLELARRERKRAEQEALERAMAKAEAERQEYQRQLNMARLEQQKAAQEKRRLAAALQAKLKREAEEKKKEEAIQRKLRTMGVCIQGYRWLRNGSGYHCAGGSHYISDDQLR